MKKSKKTTSQPQLTNSAKQSFGLSTVDFKIILFLIAYLLIDFLPYFKSIEIIHPQFLYLSILNLIVAGFIYKNPQIFDTNLIALLKKNYVFLAYVAFIGLSFLSVFGAKNISLAILQITQIFVVFCIFINLIVLLYNRLYLVYNIIFLVGVSAFFQSLQAFFGFKEVAETQSVVAALSSTYLKGNTGNINIFSASLLIKTPFILVGIAHFTNWKKWFLTIALVLVVTAVFLINARASLLSLSIITVAFLIFYLKTNIRSKATLLNAFVAFVLPFIISFAIANVVFKQTNSIDGRYTSTTARIKQIKFNSTDGSINLRLLYWNNALNFVKEKPVFGIGLGNWRVESIPFEPKGGLDLSLHTHNDFLEIMAETGIVNGIIYLSIFFALLLMNVKKLLNADTPQTKVFAFLALMLLFVYGVDSFFNFPLYRPTMQIGFCMLLVLSLVNRPKVEKLTTVNNRKNSVLLILLTIIPLYVAYNAFKTAQLENSILLDNANIDKSLPTALSGDDVVNSQPKFPNVFSSSESFIEHAAVYYVYEKKYELAKKYLDSADKINPYLATPDFLRYYIALTSGKVDSAYFYIKSCFYKRPSVKRNFIKAIETASYKKDTIELLKMYDAVFKVNPTSESWATVYDALLVNNLSSTAINKFMKQGLNNFPNDSLVIKRHNNALITKHLVEGQRLFTAGKHEKALKEYKKGLAIEPTNVFVMQNIAFYYYNLSQTQQAINYFLKALSSPGLTGGQTEFYLALCYLNINNRDKACQYFNIANANGFANAKAALNQYCN